MKVSLTTETTELNHTITSLFSEGLTSLLPTVKNRSSAAVTHSAADHSAYPFANKISLCAEEGLGLLRLSPSLLKNRVWGRYFKSKIYEIEKLENEIELVEKMDIQEYALYSQGHCPLIKTKTALISHCFFWIKHYQQQILSVLNQNG